MIKISENRTDLNFGNGDICITSGHYLNENNNRIGVVSFINQPPREIGSKGIIVAGEQYKLGDFPVVMTFGKTESIDVLINELSIAKNEMSIKENGENTSKEKFKK